MTNVPTTSYVAIREVAPGRILFIAVTIIVFPMMRLFNRHEIEL